MKNENIYLSNETLIFLFLKYIRYVKKIIVIMAKLTRKLNFNVSSKVEIIYNPK